MLGVAFVALVETIALEELAHQALIAEVDSALQADFLRAAMVVHEFGGESVEQSRGASQFVFGKSAENPGQRTVSLFFIGSEQSAARLGEGKANLTPVRLPFCPAEQLATHQFVDCFAGGRIADAQEQSYVADGVGFCQLHHLEKLELRQGQMPVGNLLQHPFLQDLFYRRGEDVRASQKVIRYIAVSVLGHVESVAP
jgi:hypothetical protein